MKNETTMNTSSDTLSKPASVLLYPYFIVILPLIRAYVA